MPLNQKQSKLLSTWFDKHNVNPNCPACGRKDMWAAGEIISSEMLNENSYRVEGKLIPMVQLVCNNCAHIMLFAATPIGLAK